MKKLTNREVRTALRGSIKKWEDIANGTGTDEGPTNCHLCNLFWDEFCRGCPVSEHTGVASCDHTPYAVSWVPVQGYSFAPTCAVTEAQKSAARKELRFLRMLEKKYFEGMPE